MNNKKQRRLTSGLKSFGNTVWGLFSPNRRKRETEQAGSVIEREETIESPWRAVVRKFIRNPLGLIGVVCFLLIFAIVFIGSAMLEFNPFYSAGAMKNVAPGYGYLTIPSQLKQEGIADIQSGITFSVGLSKAGKVYVWGVDTDENLQMPKAVQKELGDKKIRQIAVGDRHILVLTEDDTVLGWGNASFNQEKVPADLKAIAKREGIEKIGAGDQYSVILTKAGNIKIWGSTLPNRLNTVPKEYAGRVKDFRTGSVNILLQTVDNEIRVIGSGGSELQTQIPEDLKAGKVQIADFERLQNSAAVLDAEGKLHIWGSTIERVDTMPKIEEKVTSISAGRSHFTVLTESGAVKSWGIPEYDVLEAPTDSGYHAIYSGFYSNYAVKEDGSASAWGLKGFRLGTDKLGRDMFTRLLHGGKATLQISFVAVIIQIVIGVIVGMIAGFYGGRIDNLLMRFSEIIASFPFYPTIITLSAAIPPDASQYVRILMVMGFLGLLSWTGIARLIRGQILAEREKDYITAARALGLKEGSIMMSHIFPNIVSIVIVQATLGYASNLLSEAGLSFLGFGVVEPYPSWGNMMSAAQTIDVIEKYWWQWIFPGLAVFMTALSVNLIGDALRDAIDPKSQER